MLKHIQNNIYLNISSQSLQYLSFKKLNYPNNKATYKASFIIS